MRDLGKWATEEYRMPVEDASDQESKPAWVPRIVPKDPSEED